MTCIVGLVNKDKVFIGADSIAVSGTSRTIRSDQKVFINGDMVMGFTSSFRMGQLLQYVLKPPMLHSDQDVFEYMVVDFVEAVRTTLKEGGNARINDNEEYGGAFLVGLKGRLFEIDNVFQVGESVIGYAAAGCGDDIALGSLFTSNDTGMDPEDRIHTALKAASSFSTSVAPPFHILSI